MPGFNKLITRGMGKSRGQSGRSGLITQGYGGIYTFVLEAFRRVRYGSSGKRKPNKEVMVSAKLIEFNGREPKNKIEGKILVTVNDSVMHAIVKQVSAKVKDVTEYFRISLSKVIQ
jgi:hypothetical protein